MLEKSDLCIPNKHVFIIIHQETSIQMTHRKTRGVRYLFLQSLVVMLLNYPKTAFKNRKKSKSVKLNE